MPERFALARPLEAEIKPDGSGNAIYQIVASDREMATRLVQDLDEHFGTKSVEISAEEYEKRSFFGLSASNWKMCDWEPKGPKKNWGTPPANPSLN